MPYRIVHDNYPNGRKFAAMTDDDIRCWTKTGNYMKFSDRESAEIELKERETLGHIRVWDALVEKV